MRRALFNLISLLPHQSRRTSLNIRLEGGAALEDASSSASLPRLRPPEGAPRLAADMLGCNGELVSVSDVLLVHTHLCKGHYLMWDMCVVWWGCYSAAHVSLTPALDDPIEALYASRVRRSLA